MSPAVEYLAKPRGTWLVVPGIRGTLLLTANSRIDLLKSHAGIDILAMYPAVRQPTKLADAWTWDNFLVAAEACHKAANPFGLPPGVTTDAVDWIGALFRAFGAELVDSNGNIAINSDAVGQALEYAKRLTQFLPPDVGAWDNASNNKVPRLRQGCLDFQPAKRVGGGQTRHPEGRRATVDARHAEGPQGSLRFHAAALPGAVELLQEQVGRQEPDGLRVHALGRRETGGRGPRAMICRPSSNSMTLRPGTSRRRPKAPYRTIPTRAIKR